MSVVLGPKFTEANRKLLDAFSAFADGGKSVMEAHVMQIQDSAEVFTHAFPEGFSDLQDLKGEFNWESPKLLEINGKCRDVGKGLAVSVKDLNNGNVAKYIPKLTDLGKKKATFVDQEVARVLGNGATTGIRYQNYDAKPLFSTTHTLADGTTVSNYDSSGTSLTFANLKTKYAAMMGRVDNMGQPAGIVPAKLIVPSALAVTAMALINDTLVNDGSNVQVTNTLRGALQLIVLPQLDAYSATTWYLLGEKNGVPAFVFYEFIPLELSVMDDPQSFSVFNHNEVRFRLYGSCETLAGPWQLLSKHVG